MCNRHTDRNKTYSKERTDYHSRIINRKLGKEKTTIKTDRKIKTF